MRIPGLLFDYKGRALAFVLSQADGSFELSVIPSTFPGPAALYDEEVPREGARITRQRRMARWTDGSTWLWTSFRNQAGQGEGSSQLTFDQVIEPGDHLIAWRAHDRIRSHADRAACLGLPQFLQQPG